MFSVLKVYELHEIEVCKAAFRQSIINLSDKHAKIYWMRPILRNAINGHA